MFHRLKITGTMVQTNALNHVRKLPKKHTMEYTSSEGLKHCVHLTRCFNIGLT